MECEGGIIVDGNIIYPAQLNNTIQNAFTVNKITFCRPRWVVDSESDICGLCAQKFSMLRWRHHCRQCGKLYCAECCKNKVILLHLCYPDLQRVCDVCKPVAETLFLALSPQQVFQCEAAKKLADLCATSFGLIQMFELGGVVMLVHLAHSADITTKREILRAFGQLMDMTHLHLYFTSIGSLKALFSFLNDSEDKSLQMDTLELIRQFCKNPDIKYPAIEAGALQALYRLLISPHVDLLLVVLNILGAIVECKDTHVHIMDKGNGNYVTKLLNIATRKEEKVQAGSLYILAHLSSECDQHRQTIMMEDIYQGCCILNLLRQKPTNVDVHFHTICLTANLADTSHTQGGVRDHLVALCQLLQDYAQNVNLVAHITRGIANFAKFEQNATIILDSIPHLAEICLESSKLSLRQEALRAVLYLLKYMPKECADKLQSSGTSAVLHCLSENPTVMDAALIATQTLQPRVLKPNLMDVTADRVPVNNEHQNQHAHDGGDDMQQVHETYRRTDEALNSLVHQLEAGEMARTTTTTTSDAILSNGEMNPTVRNSTDERICHLEPQTHAQGADDNP